MRKLERPDEAFYRSNVTFTSVPDVVEISKPLASLGLSYFTFDRTYLDGSHIRLTNAGAWIESYYRTELYRAAIFEKDPKMFFNGYVFWDWLSHEPVYSAAAQHDIDHGVTIIEKHESYSDFFHFGTTRDNPISQETMTSHLDYLYRFIAYFKQKMHPLIVEGENTRIILPAPPNQTIKKTDLTLDVNSTNIDEFFKKTEVTRLYLGDEFNDAYLTRKEINILQLLRQDRKTTSIAAQLNISERTLESHIKNIKEKFNCDTLFMLGFHLGEISMKNVYPFKIEQKE